ncbi:MAG: ATP-binding protein [Bacteroidetes bacterium]|nr:ATP-binding protein [Bacteroidota bacterium]
MNSDRVTTVVLMGAESTGKTTLAAALAKHYNTIWAAEYLRLFVDEKGALPEEADVHVIAKGHLDLVASMQPEAHRVLFVDTDLFTTCVYQRIYFGECPPSIERAAKRHQSGLYLFVEPDIPWIPDPGQRSSPQERLRSHVLLMAEAKTHSLNTVPICGTQDQRLTTAIKAVDHYLTKGQYP